MKQLNFVPTLLLLSGLFLIFFSGCGGTLTTLTETKTLPAATVTEIMTSTPPAEKVTETVAGTSPAQVITMTDTATITVNPSYADLAVQSMDFSILGAYVEAGKGFILNVRINNFGNIPSSSYTLEIKVVFMYMSEVYNESHYLHGISPGGDGYYHQENITLTKAGMYIVYAQIIESDDEKETSWNDSMEHQLWVVSSN